MANASGTFSRPPANAPYEVATGGVSATADQIAMARRNEKVLPPFNPQPTPGQILAAKNAAPVEDPVEILLFIEPDPVQETVEPVEAQPIELAPIQPYQPAASDSDSPSRGIPRPLQKGKEITGGFGDLGEAQYFPLDGSELGKVAIALMKELSDRIPNDLRFGMAVTYPRATVRVDVTVEGFAMGQTFNITKVATPPGQAHLKTAQKHGEEIVFVVRSEYVEMTPEGESVTAPNQIRMDLGLTVPRKHVLESSFGNRMMADI